MTRINTNVSSLVAQNRLQSSNNDLQTSLTRLSTGLRINSGSDDPAGLIASEALRSEITGLNKAISNTSRANQIISTADSALGQVSNLLNDVRGLVVEAANTGALSSEEIAANQLQIDSSLEAINRIAQTTTFQGRKLLDGSLGFQTSAGTNFAKVKDLQVDQASLGSTGKVSVDVTVSKAAEQATVAVADIPAGITATAATGDITFTSQTAAVASTLDFTLGGEDFTLTADTAGAAGDDLSITVVASGGTGTSPVVSKSGDDYTITLASDSTATADDIATAFNAFVDANDDDATLTTTGGATNVGAATLTQTSLAGGADAGTAETATINLTASVAGTASNISSISYVEATGTTTPTAAFDSGTGVLTITVDDASSVTLSSVVDAIEAGTDFTAEIETGGDFTTFDPTISTAASANLVDGVDAGGGLAEAAVFELQGANGSEVFNVSKNTSIDELVSQINLVSDATGVKATKDGTTLNLTSTAYGSDAVVDLRVINEAASGTLTAAVGAGKRDTGADIQAKVNGIEANGKGNSLNINTSTLDLSLTVEEGSSDNISFDITGGGAKFQLGADVVGNQQARIGINSVNTARLGGTSGKLFELSSGGAASLANDPSKAAEIVSQAIEQVTGIRGRLGAFQSTTLDSNLVSLNETLSNLQEAESSIRDADFAKESANLTRAQILVQSGTNVLSLANQNPQNVLSLLR
ncbi:flagellin [Novipirellula sp.]|uniref:flagellin N-terminal helical domain-containing protein n=1 Tax=Novipirellula sp. TaxID=2795430 RepID=UPI00356849D3